MPLSVKRVISKIRRAQAWLHKNFYIKDRDPKYTVWQLRAKIISIGIGGIAIDMVGQKIRSIEAINQLTGGTLGWDNIFYVYLLGVQGLALGLVFWRILEVYWWATNRVKKGDNYA